MFVELRSLSTTAKRRRIPALFLQKSLLRKDFDFLRSPRSTVALYADDRALLVFRAFWQSDIVSKT